MAIIFWTIVALVLILTGAIVPVLIFGGWALVAVLTIVLLIWLIAKALGLLIEPFAVLGAAIAEAVGSLKRPPKLDPDHDVYLSWANRTGEFGGYEHWSDVKRELEARRTSNIERERWEQKDQKRRQKEEKLRKKGAI